MGGGQCADCARKKSGLQRKLTIGASNDPLEQEADRIADQVMTKPTHSQVNSVPPRIQRFTGHATGEMKAAPASVDRVLASSGRPLEPSLRQDMEQRFGQDFSRVRVHTGAAAEQSARDVSANAYTVDSHIVFGQGQFAPRTNAGQYLIAHELTHVVQQGSKGSKNLVTDNNGDIARSAVGIIQRKLVVNSAASIPLPSGTAGPPTPLTLAVQGLLRDTCPNGGASVDSSTGAVTLGAGVCDWAGVPYVEGVRRADISPTPAGCGCLCDVVNHARTTTIDFRAGGPGTSPGSVVGAGPGQGGVQTDSTVTIDPRFQGQYLISGRWVDVPFHLLMAHEVCGHALPKMRGAHVARGPSPSGGTPPQERHAVDVERAIAAEGGHPRRPEDYSGAARQRP